MNVKKTLVVFDFDGTLFKSPLRPSKWKGRWWSDSRSLSPPLVPEEPGDEWWNDKICEQAFDSLTDNSVYTVLLTGRLDKVFNERVHDLLESKGLRFPYVGLAELDTSIDSKIQHLDKLLTDNHFIEKIIFYDDRTEHFPLFENYCEEKQLDCEVIPVKESSIVLEQQEKQKNKVYILIGPPGVGKTTYINKNIPEEVYQISRDDIAERVGRENGLTYTQMFGNSELVKQLNKQINSELDNNIDLASKGNKDVVIDMTNMSVKSRKNLLNRFKSSQFIRIALDFMPNISNFENLMKSNTIRNLELNKSGKDKIISRSVLERMFANYEPPTEQEGFDQIKKIDVDSRLGRMNQA